MSLQKLTFENNINKTNNVNFFTVVHPRNIDNMV